jgi:hypothetical protein
MDLKKTRHLMVVFQMLHKVATISGTSFIAWGTFISWNLVLDINLLYMQIQ